MALFTRTGPDRFNILIRFYGSNIGPHRTFYEHERTEQRNGDGKAGSGRFIQFSCITA